MIDEKSAMKRPIETRVILETPLAAPDKSAFTDYARACARDCLSRGEAPLGSHLLYAISGVLNDDDKQERLDGMNAGFLWGEMSDYTVVYVDLGISGGMWQGIERALQAGRRVEMRRLSSDRCGSIHVDGAFFAAGDDAGAREGPESLDILLGAGLRVARAAADAGVSWTPSDRRPPPSRDD